MTRSRWRVPVVLVVLAATLSGCSTTTTELEPVPRSAPVAVSVPEVGVLDGLSLEQRVGQLFMVGTSATIAEGATIAAVRDRFVGSVFLSGRSRAGVEATAGVVASLTAANSGSTGLFVATDQEGGQVQVLSGPGFSAIPTATQQGQMDPEALTTAAERWGDELTAAGVNFNLAPVADIVSGPRSNNQPIARYDREYGYDATTVTTHAGAFLAGMTAAGVSSTIKHFPGLGYVVGNTDVVADVTDTVIGADGPTVHAFGSLIDAGAPVVMMSSAYYDRIDASRPAVFSPTVVGLLRDSLGFEGLIMTDDLSAAAAVRAWSPGQRAILAIDAGVDLVLVSASPALAAGMIDAVVARAQADPAFDELVNAAATRVLLQKAVFGLGG